MTKSFETFRGGVFPWEIDIMGHMNVRHYTAKFDDATLQLFGALGLTVAYFKEQDRGMAAVQQNTTYGRELLAGDLIEVKSEILEAGERKIRFLHRMYECLSGDEASTCEITGVHIDRTLRRSTPFPAHIHEKALEMSKG
jgi:acyl-CoA thioester hydrolase